MYSTFKTALSVGEDLPLSRFRPWRILSLLLWAVCTNFVKVVMPYAIKQESGAGKFPHRFTASGLRLPTYMI